MKNSSSFSLPARAKINLWLNIGPKEPSGFHSLRTAFQELDFKDTLMFSPRPNGIHLKISGASLDPGPSNLVTRALTQLQRALNISSGISVHLQKRIPMGAGLGGGSSDAATALWGGWILWKKKTPKIFQSNSVPPILLRLASKLGSDVPFFLRGGLALGEGRGERLVPLMGSRPRKLVLAWPSEGVPTAWAYRELDAWREKKKIRPPLDWPSNDFEPVVFYRFPKVRKIKRIFETHNLSQPLMSGSGATVFGFLNPDVNLSALRRDLDSAGMAHVLTRTVV